MSNGNNNLGYTPQWQPQSAPADPNLSNHYRLLILDPHGRKLEYPITGELLIGSSEHNHIVIQDPHVAPQHLFVGGSDDSYWFREDDGGNGVYLNGEAAYEGWLKGGEEIQIGQTRIFFQAPELAAMPEIGDFGLDLSGGPDDDGDLGDFGSFLDEGYSAPPQDTGKKRSGAGTMAVMFGLYLGAFAILGLGLFIFWQKQLNAPPKAEQRESALILVTQQMFQGIALMEKNQWQAAAKALNAADKIAPQNTDMRKVLAGKVKRAREQWDSLSKFRKAKKIYFELDKGGEALIILRKIPKDRHIYKAARDLYTKIYNKNIKRLISEARSYISKKDIEKTQKTLAELYKYNDKHPAAAELQQQFENLQVATPEGRRALQAELAKFQAGIDLFKNGKQNQALAYFKKFKNAKFSAVKRKAQGYVKSILSFKNVLAQGNRAYRSGNYSAAITHLSRVRRMDESLGGGNRSKYVSKLSRAYANNGKKAYSAKDYARAYRNFKRSNAVQANGRARAGLSRLRRKARGLIKEAGVLRGIDNSTARKILRKVLKMVPASDPLYRKARRMIR